jgi:hypothetical protein
MRVFDALIGNTERSPTTMLYDTTDLLLILTNHGDTFDAGTVWSGYFSPGRSEVNDEWRKALRRLDDDALQAKLGEVLNVQQLEALRQRRDALLDSPAVLHSD